VLACGNSCAGTAIIKYRRLRATSCIRFSTQLAQISTSTHISYVVQMNTIRRVTHSSVGSMHKAARALSVASQVARHIRWAWFVANVSCVLTLLRPAWHRVHAYSTSAQSRACLAWCQGWCQQTAGGACARQASTLRASAAWRRTLALQATNWAIALHKQVASHHYFVPTPAGQAHRANNLQPQVAMEQGCAAPA
jgi:hypothetical protein